MSRGKKLEGLRFGKLVALRIYGRHHTGQNLWVCKCDCGNIKNVTASRLIKGDTRSCGCLKSENLSARKEPGHAAISLSHQQYKKGATRRNLSFSLTREQFIDIVTKDCFYCGDSPSIKAVAPGNNGYFIRNGIDRVDSSKGYYIENCVPCCTICNRAKSNTDMQGFIDWIYTVHNNLVEKSFAVW